MAIPSVYPKIVCGGTTIWIPGGITKLDPAHTMDAVITKGHSTIQTQYFPERWTFTGTTVPWHPTSESWMNGYTNWFLGWNYYWTNYIGRGVQFSFYRVGSYSGAADGIHRFDKCCWTGKDDGITQLVGYERYQLDIEFETELVAR